ncbi:MAG: carbohydrate porin [Sphingobacteriales bacterium]|nr:MAG: carbohydrate porin [Sphingobacteriales bacterium]
MKHFIAFLSACCIAPASFAQNYEFRNSDRVIETPGNNTVESQRFNLHVQATYIVQYKPFFNAPYTGDNSLITKDETQNSITGTLYAGLRLWKGAAVYVNPEMAGGSGLSGALGMAGSSNGETFRVGNPSPTLYLARAYFQQTFSLARKGEMAWNSVEDETNQLSGFEPKRYLRITAGKISVGDFFDNNEYGNSPRQQFINWALMNNGAWDYSANTRGYTVGLVGQLKMDKMSYALGLTLLPKEANGPKLNYNLEDAYAINAEAARNITIRNRPGTVRLLGYYNTANMGQYTQAIDRAVYNNTIPYLTTKAFGGKKLGFGLNADQQLSDLLGVFARVGWNNGKYETWCFTEIDQTASLGVKLDGKKWHRDEDHAGIAIVANSISKEHRQYLAFGGKGFIIGDGQLNYAPEAIAELYYSFKPIDKDIWLTGDYQFCLNPAYNADRGPVHIFSVRLHVEL